jgi:hypothetical protein
MTGFGSTFDCKKNRCNIRRKKTDGFGGILNSNRFYWLLAIILLPVPMLLAYNMFSIGCRCPCGLETARVYDKGMYLLWIRLFAGLLLGEKRSKIIIYMIMPFVIALVVSVLGQMIWPHNVLP